MVVNGLCSKQPTELHSTLPISKSRYRLWSIDNIMYPLSGLVSCVDQLILWSIIGHISLDRSRCFTTFPLSFGCVYKILRTEKHCFETRIWNTVLKHGFTEERLYKSFLPSVILALSDCAIAHPSFCAACPLAKGQTGRALFDLDHCDVI